MEKVFLKYISYKELLPRARKNLQTEQEQQQQNQSS